MDTTSGELICVSLGVIVVSARFAYQFLDKYHTRHIGPGPQPSHRHISNKRSKRRGVVVVDFDTQEITKLKKAPESTGSSFFGTESSYDKDATLIIER